MPVHVKFSKKKINPVYHKYINSRFSYEIYWGGAGSGKSHFIAQKCLIKCLQEPYFRLVFSRKHSVDIRDIQFLLFKDLIREYNLGPLFQIRSTSMDIICKNGNMLLSAGIDDPEKIKSLQAPTDIWTEEITEFDFEDFEQLDLRLRGSKAIKRQFFMSFNPIDEEHWVKKELFDKPLENSTKLHTTYLDNTFIDQDEYEKKLDRKNGHNRDIYKFGKWGRARTGMEYFPAFDDKHIGKPEYNANIPLHITFDMNVNPYMTLLVTQIEVIVDKIWLKVIDEFCLPHPLNKTKYVCQAFKRKYESHKAGLFFYGDATAQKNNTMTVDEIKHDYDIVESELRTMLNNGSNRVSKANPPVIKRKDFFDDILRDQTPIVILIHERCTNTIKDFKYLKEGADGKKFKEVVPDKITGAKYQLYGHTSDALEYEACFAFEKIFRQYERR